MLSLGSIIRKGSRITDLDLSYWPIHALQIPLDVRQRFLYMKLDTLLGLNVFSYTTEALQWLGGLRKLFLRLHQNTWSRFPQFGKIKHLQIHGPEIVTIGTLYFCRECRIEHLFNISKIVRNPP